MNPYTFLKKNNKKYIKQTNLWHDSFISLIHATATFNLINFTLICNNDTLKNIIYNVLTINSSLYFYHDIKNHDYNMVFLHHIISPFLLILGYQNVIFKNLIIKGAYYAEISNFALLISDILLKSSKKEIYNKFKLLILLTKTFIYSYFRIVKCYEIIYELFNSKYINFIEIFCGTLMYTGGFIWSLLLLKQILNSIISNFNRKMLLKINYYNPYSQLDYWLYKKFNNQTRRWCTCITTLIHCLSSVVISYIYLLNNNLIRYIIYLNSILYFINDSFHNNLLSVLNIHHIISVLGILYGGLYKKEHNNIIYSLYKLESGNWVTYVIQLLFWSTKGQYWKKHKNIKWLILLQNIMTFYTRICYIKYFYFMYKDDWLLLFFWVFLSVGSIWWFIGVFKKLIKYFV